MTPEEQPFEAIGAELMEIADRRIEEIRDCHRPAAGAQAALQ